MENTAFYFHLFSTVQVTVWPKFSKFLVSRHLLKLCYDENTQFFYLLCSQFRQKASGWINKTLLLIKQHTCITYMNISRYTNIDKFVNIQYIFLLLRQAYNWLFQLAQMWKLLAPGIGLTDFLTPVLVSDWLISKKSSSLKLLCQMNQNLVRSILGRLSIIIKIMHLVPIR